MELDKKLLEALEEVFSLTTEKCVTMAIRGSYLLDYIRHHHDIDINIYFKEVDSHMPFIRPEYKKRYKELSKWLAQEYHVGIVFYTLSGFEKYRYFPYQYLMGEELTYFIPENIEERKRDYSLYLKEILWPMVEDKTVRHGTPTKQSYYVLIGLYSIQNNFEEFSEEQINNINIVHDQEDLDKINELYEWMRKEIEKIHY